MPLGDSVDALPLLARSDSRMMAVVDRLSRPVLISPTNTFWAQLSKSVAGLCIGKSTE